VIGPEGRRATDEGSIRRGRLVLCTLVLLVAQGAVVHRFGVGVLRLDLLLLAAAYLALEAPARPALFWALALGLLRDACSLGRPGAGAFAFAAAAGLVVLARDCVQRDWLAVRLALALAFGLVVGLSQAAGTWLVLRGDPGALLGGAVGQAALSALCAGPVFCLFDAIGIVERERSFSET